MPVINIVPPLFVEEQEVKIQVSKVSFESLEKIAPPLTEELQFLQFNFLKVIIELFKLINPPLLFDV